MSDVEIEYHIPKAQISVWKKVDPTWWIRNDYEQPTPDWYHPEWSPWRRNFYWTYLRNPFQNFRCFVIGVADRGYMVSGKRPVWTVQRDDLVPPELGWQWSVIHLGLGLPFVSYSGHRVVWYAGWQPTGIFGLKFNIRSHPL